MATAYTLRRLALAVLEALLVSVITFLLPYLGPGGAAQALLGPHATPEAINALQGQVSGPIWQQYFAWLLRIVHGDFGVSFATGRSVLPLILSRLPATLELDGIALAVAFAFTFVIGGRLATARAQESSALLSGIGLVGLAFPAFALGLLLQFFFGVHLRLLPIFGRASVDTTGFATAEIIKDYAVHLVLPVLTLSIGAIALTLWQTRGAFARGLVPSLPLIGLQAGVILGGTFIVEVIFAWNGIGHLAIQAIANGDIPVVQGVVLLVALAYLVISLLMALESDHADQYRLLGTPGLLTLAHNAPVPRDDARAGVFADEASRDSRLVVGFILVTALVLVAIFVPVLAHQDPNRIDLFSTAVGPSPQHVLGTDDLGRDELARLLYGARLTLLVSALSVALAAIVGSLLGLMIGGEVPFLSPVARAITDALLAFPAPVLALAVAAVRAPSQPTVVVAVSLAFIPTFSRLMTEERPFLAATDAETPTLGMAGKPSAPLVRLNSDALALILAQIPLSVSLAIGVEATLSFLGLGIQPPDPDWGMMIEETVSNFVTNPVLLIAPTLAIALTMLSLNLLGDALRDRIEAGRTISGESHTVALDVSPSALL